jgi:DNA gyrase subunit A
VGIAPALPKSEVAFLTSAERVVILPIDSVEVLGKDGTGDRIPKLKPEEKIISVTAMAM